MNYSGFFRMIPEASLIAILIVLLVTDFAMAKTEERKWFNPLASVLLLLDTFMCLYPTGTQSLFGGMCEMAPAVDVMKAILSMSTFIVVVQSRAWAVRSGKEAGFYMLIVPTLLGMFTMMSAGNFLMFFPGLKMASVPLSRTVAFDMYRKSSAEGAAKFILTATFPSDVMLYGINFLYDQFGTPYFDDIATKMQATPLVIVGLVFFFSGLDFKISLVPPHFWAANTYQGAPVTITGYLSIISKGAAALTLLSILFYVFDGMMEYWHVLLMIVVVLSVIIANLFAVCRNELKRFMAFSSISRAGYIMLAAIGNNWANSVAALSYYVLIYVVANMAVFTTISVVERNNGGKTNIDDCNGFYQTNPRLSFLMTLTMFSLDGIPPFAGMFSKFFIFVSDVNGADINTTMGAWVYEVVFAALLNTVISLYYYLKIVKAMYIVRTDNPLPTFRSDCNTKFALAICMTGILLSDVCSFVYERIAVTV